MTSVKRFAFNYLLILVVTCLVTWLIWARFRYPLAGIDDSNIFFVYAENFAHGHGFVYNVGGERVEGFSSLLWTLISAAIFFLSPVPEQTLLILNVIIISLGIAVAVSYIPMTFVSQQENRFRRWGWALLFLFLLLTSANYLIWNTIVLMENAVWSTLLLCGTIFVISEDISSQKINSIFVPIAVLLLLTRPEAFLWVGVFSTILLVRKTLLYGIRSTLRELLPLFASLAITVLALTVFRRLYFGYPLPNTYYAKVSPSITYNVYQGAVYLAKYFISNPVVSLCILVAMLTGVHTVVAFVQKKNTDDGLLYLPILAGTGLLAPMVTGGDHFSSFRFYQGTYPILVLCLIYFMKVVLPLYVKFDFHPGGQRWPQLVFVSILSLSFLAGLAVYQVRDWLPSREFSRMTNEFEIAAEGRVQGQFIREMFSPLPQLPSLGVIRAGGIKYTYPGEVIDLMGLNNLRMAHNGGDRRGEKNHAAFEKSTFYELTPDLVSPQVVSNTVWSYDFTELHESWDNTVPFKGLYDDSTFLKLYVYAKVCETGFKSGSALVGWFRQAFLNELEASGDFVIERYAYRSKVSDIQDVTRVGDRQSQLEFEFLLLIK